MRVLICSKEDIVANILLNRLIPRLDGHRVGVLLANRERAKTATEPSLTELKLLEEQIPRQVLFPLADAAPVPGDLLSFGWLARRHGIDLLPASGLDADGRSRSIAGFAPDLILCLKYGYVLRPQDLALPRLGAINLHSGRLPERPGLHAIFWAMHAGEAHATCAVHRIAPDIDSGALIGRRDVVLDYGRSFFWNMLRTYEAGTDLLGDIAVALAAGEAVPEQPQPAGDWPMLGLPDEADIAAFRARGGVWIDPADYLELAERYAPRR